LSIFLTAEGITLSAVFYLEATTAEILKRVKLVAVWCVGADAIRLLFQNLLLRSIFII